MLPQATYLSGKKKKKKNLHFCKCTVGEKNTETFAVNQGPKRSIATPDDGRGVG